MDHLFKAFADHNRLRILNLLTEGELCVCDIMSVLKIRQSRISRHLAYLRRHGLVKARKQGLWVYYQLAKPQGNVHKNLLEGLSACADEMPLMKKDKNALGRLQKTVCA